MGSAAEPLRGFAAEAKVTRETSVSEAFFKPLSSDLQLDIFLLFAFLYEGSDIGSGKLWSPILKRSRCCLEFNLYSPHGLAASKAGCQHCRKARGRIFS